MILFKNFMLFWLLMTWNKLKEVNSAKGGDTNAKAQQYLDGLLRVPFGIYSQEVIMSKQDELKNSLNKDLEDLHTDLCNILENFKLVEESINYIKWWYYIIIMVRW